MIKITENLDELKREIASLNKDIEIDRIVNIDLPFIESQKEFTVINIPSYGGEKNNNIIFIIEKKVFVYTSINLKKFERKFEKIIKKKNGESTVSIFMLLKSILKIIYYNDLSR